MDEKRIVEEINKIFHNITAELYDSQHPEIFEGERIRIREIFKKVYKKYMNVLDVGAGSGFVYWAVKDLVVPERFYMLDLSIGMLRRAKSRCSRCNYINASVSHLPLKDESFDLIIFNSVLHHLPDIYNISRETYRILKHNGKIIINHEPNYRFSNNAFLWYQAIILNYIIRFLNPIKTCRRLISKIRGIKHPVYDRINEYLINAGIIDKPLRYEQIGAYIDYLSPTAGYIRRGRGIDINIFKDMYKIKYIDTYDHLGKISEKYKFAIVRVYNSILKRIFPLDGAKISVILEK